MISSELIRELIQHKK